MMEEDGCELVFSHLSAASRCVRGVEIIGSLGFPLCSGSRRGVGSGR